MTEGLTITNTHRRKKIRLLQELGRRLKDSGDMAVHGVGCGDTGFRQWDEAYAIRWALDYVQRHINLHTGEIRAVNPEPAEVE